jgi:hypothetical protein
VGRWKAKHEGSGRVVLNNLSEQMKRWLELARSIEFGESLERFKKIAPSRTEMPFYRADIGRDLALAIQPSILAHASRHSSSMIP